ncbi:hypothetical protein [Asticcacaulis sp. AND118]|uniref:hypothetical protein n=1 Tax=Asticcacaulis sp. AND118 TaxID=2840468 RepID=UPI001CFF7061|nr:hypothetical protein [Asticcacaulis sp. AND118]UDF04843.1 hypothetical protein LH365_04970 [Asticcacaulis sp. AND118]
MRLDRMFADFQQARDLLAALMSGDEAQDFLLPLGKQNNLVVGHAHAELPAFCPTEEVNGNLPNLQLFAAFPPKTHGFCASCRRFRLHGTSNAYDARRIVKAPHMVVDPDPPATV